MIASVIAQRYAKALLASAQDQGVEDRLAGEASALAEALGDDPDVKRFLATPLSTVQSKLEVLMGAFPEPPHTLLRQFLRAVLENRRERYLAGMLKQFLKMLRDIRGEMTGELTTAFRLEPQQRAMLETELSQRFSRKVQLIPVVDRRLIGGAMLRVEDTVYDGSLRGSLERLEKELKNGPEGDAGRRGKKKPGTDQQK